MARDLAYREFGLGGAPDISEAFPAVASPPKKLEKKAKAVRELIDLALRSPQSFDQLVAFVTGQQEALADALSGFLNKHGEVKGRYTKIINELYPSKEDIASQIVSEKGLSRGVFAAKSRTNQVVWAHENVSEVDQRNVFVSRARTFEAGLLKEMSGPALIK